MPEFDAEVVRELIATNRIAAITIDSNVIHSFSRSGNLAHPLLKSLGALKAKGVQVLLSQVVASESEGHFLSAMMETYRGAKLSLTKLTRVGGTIKDAADTALAILPAELTQEANLKAEYTAFLNMLGAEIVEADEQTSFKEILELYFANRPPFANAKKKTEFPDGIAVTSLQHWSDVNGDLIVVSKDEDWRGYFRQSATAHIVPDLRTALAIFQEDELLAAAFVKALRALDGTAVAVVEDALKYSLADMDFDVDHNSDWIVEIEPCQAWATEIEIIGDDQSYEVVAADATSATLSIAVAATVRVEAYATFSVMDPIDRGEVEIATETIHTDVDHVYIVVVTVAGKGAGAEMEIVDASVSPETKLGYVNFEYVSWGGYPPGQEDYQLPDRR